MIFQPPVNTDKPKFVAFLVFVCTTASFIAQISSFENALETRRHLGSGRKTVTGIAKDIPSYGSHSKRAKSAIH